MAFLIIETGPETGRKVDLHGGVLVIGRQSQAGLSIKDAKASRENTRIESAAGSWCVVDLQSTNGTMLNGRKVQREFLKAGDRVTVGATVFRFEEADANPDMSTQAMKEPGTPVAPAPGRSMPVGRSGPVSPRPSPAPAGLSRPVATESVRPVAPLAAAAADPNAEIVERGKPKLRYQEQASGPGFFTIVICTAILVGLVFAARWIAQHQIGKLVLEKKQGQTSP